MNKTLLVILLILIAGAGVYLFAFGGVAQVESMLGQGAQPTVVSPLEAGATAQAAIPPVVASTELNVAGRLTPARRLDLTFTTEGKVAEILVKEGELVKEGQLLAKLELDADLNLAVSRSRLEVMNAEKAINDLYLEAPTLAAQANYDIIQTQKELEKAENRRRAMDYKKATQKEIDDAYKDYKAAQSALEKIEGYAKSEDKEIRDLYKEAIKVRDTALSKYNYLISDYSEKDKAEAEANVMLYQAKLEDLQRKYEIYKAGPDPEALKIAQAKLEVAKAELASAEANLADVELRAPFSGTIMQINIEVGQMVTPTETSVLLADISRWHIETEDLTELAVTRITEGQKATVKFDALPDVTFEGTVVDIKNIGEDKKGDITYTAKIEIPNTDPRLRWNMTSPIVIKTK